MLLNNNEIHNINIKLNKNIPRERRFREYLDINVIDGKNRKETILNMFENMNNNIINKDNYKNIQENIKVTKQCTDIDITDFEGI